MKIALFVARIYNILFSDLTSLRWSEAWMALIFGTTLAVCTAKIQSQDPTFYEYVIPLWGWSTIFIIYGFFKLILVIEEKNWFWVRSIVSVIGVCIWSYIFVVSAIFTPFSATDTLFLMPILAESWFLATTLGVKNYGIRITATN